jgi:hypothetical protein
MGLCVIRSTHLPQPHDQYSLIYHKIRPWYDMRMNTQNQFYRAQRYIYAWGDDRPDLWPRMVQVF